MSAPRCKALIIAGIVFSGIKPRNPLLGIYNSILLRETAHVGQHAPIPRLIDAELVKKCKQLGIKLIGGNVNDKAEIDRILALGVDSYCTDYPYALLP